MLFNSFQFLIFFPLVTALFYLLPQRLRWLMLLGASCAFYMAFVPQYILILFVTIIIDYSAAIFISRSTGKRRRGWLITSIVSTCLVLFVFKYFNFASTNIKALADWLGWNYPTVVLELILPIGLSFHTFQSLSYVIEVYRGRQTPERHFGIYALYVMFYPQLVAGPIERPQNLLHQFREHHRFDYEQFTSGLRLMGWGFFKKLVIADRLAAYVNPVYADPSAFSGTALVIATVAFAYQIYCDFSGYSDIAIGAARTMGFKLMTNFDKPYFSRSIGEFWRRWHISLSTWFRDYVYVPLGGSRVSTGRWAVNILIVFLLSGLWHGANWTYVMWGLLNACYLLLGEFSRPWKLRAAQAFGLRQWPRIALMQVACTFVLVCLAWVFFRAANMSDALYILTHFGSNWTWSIPLPAVGFSRVDLYVVLVAIGILEVVQLWQYKDWAVHFHLARWPLFVRWPVYYACIFAVVILGAYEQRQFIYFQF